jgi:hypothetical protein
LAEEVGRANRLSLDALPPNMVYESSVLTIVGGKIVYEANVLK